MNNLYIFIGGSASGKTTTEEALFKEGYERLVSTTTREPREGEIDEIHYKFVEITEFNQRQMANVVPITEEWKYGVEVEELKRLASIDKDSIYSVINLEPALKIKEYIEKNDIPLNVKIIFFKIPLDIRIVLMKKRGESEKNIQIRLSREDTLEDESLADFIVRDIFHAKDLFLGYVKSRSMEQVMEHSFEFVPEVVKEVDDIIAELSEIGVWK